MDRPGFQRLEFTRLGPAAMQDRARALLGEMGRRRSIRHFSSDPIPAGVLDDCIRIAGSAPSGAHKQPWTFVVVEDAGVRAAIREAAEAEERENYAGRMNEEWLRDLAPLGTDADKPFLESAPGLIVLFRHAWQEAENGGRSQCYYSQESAGIAAGFLLMALHQVGLAALTHTPSPMAFLSRILGRPENERPFLLIPVGYPAEDCEVPALERKPLDEIRRRV
ncbi:MAG: nitroreductase family protein [Planctomycetota bacterium]